MGRNGAYFVCNEELRLSKISADGDAVYQTNLPFLYSGMACDSQGVLYMTAPSLNSIWKLVETGTPTFVLVAGAGAGFLDGAANTANLRSPARPVFDPQDNLYFLDRGNLAVRKLSPAGVVSTVAGSPSNTLAQDGQGQAAGFTQPRALALLPDGNLLVLDGKQLRKVTPGGAVSTLPAAVPPTLADATLAVQDANTAYAISGHSIVQLALDGSSSTVAGAADQPGYTEGIGTDARFSNPGSAVLDKQGQLLVADKDNHVVRRLALPSRQTSPLVGRAPQPGYVDAQGDQARFSTMGPAAVDAAGNVYVVDTAQQTLRKITPAGQVSTVLRNFPASQIAIPLLGVRTIGILAVDPSGSVFYSVRDRTIIKMALDGSTQVLAGQAGVVGFSDGQGAQATFAQPMALALDPQGNLLVADGPVIQYISGFQYETYSYTYGTTIRKITPSGAVSTLVGTPGKTYTVSSGFGSVQGSALDRLDSFVAPLSMAFDASGNLYVADLKVIGIRKVAPDGSVSLVQLKQTLADPPVLLAVSTTGSLYSVLIIASSVTSQAGVTVAKLESDGTSSTVVGRFGSTGVQTGTLPGSLGSTTSGLVAGPGNTLYCCSENSVLRINLP